MTVHVLSCFASLSQTSSSAVRLSQSSFAPVHNNNAWKTMRRRMESLVVAWTIAWSTILLAGTGTTVGAMCLLPSMSIETTTGGLSISGCYRETVYLGLYQTTVWTIEGQDIADTGTAAIVADLVSSSVCAAFLPWYRKPCFAAAVLPWCSNPKPCFPVKTRKLPGTKWRYFFACDQIPRATLILKNRLLFTDSK